eukprot:6528-Heterococcus_DN1.PRE.2
MWPRTGEERARQRNIGFVSFWRRCDAAAAKQALHSRELDGMCIQIRWGQAISKLARGIGDKTLSTDVSSDVSTVLAPVIDSAAEDGPVNVTNALPVASAGESTARTVVVEAAAQPLASDTPPPEMQEGDSSLTVVEPRSEERRYLIDRTASNGHSTACIYDRIRSTTELVEPYLASPAMGCTLHGTVLMLPACCSLTPWLCSYDMTICCLCVQICGQGWGHSGTFTHAERAQQFGVCLPV